MSRKIILVLAIFLLTAVSFAHAQKQAAIPRIGILRRAELYREMSISSYFSAI